MLGEIRNPAVGYNKPLQSLNQNIKNIKSEGCLEDGDSFCPENVSTTSAGAVHTAHVQDLSAEIESQRIKLEKVGISFSDPENTLPEKERLALMERMELTASHVSESRRPKISVTIKPRDDIKLLASGRYFPKDKHLEIYVYENNGNKRPIGKLMGTAAHEYGHAISDGMKIDNPMDFDDPFYSLMVDPQGRSLNDRAIALENKVKLQGQIPDDPINEENIYDRFDPYVVSHKWTTETGQVQEKYSRKNARENFAESFKEYVSRPVVFRNKLKKMEEYLATQGPGTEKYNKNEYEYVKESFSIMEDVYNYFKNQVFDGYEFTTPQKKKK